MYDLYAKNKDDSGLMSIVKIFNYNSGIQYCLDKTAKVTFKKASLVKSKSIIQDINTEITELEHNKTYKYLGINELKGINHTIN